MGEGDTYVLNSFHKCAKQRISKSALAGKGCFFCNMSSITCKESFSLVSCCANATFQYCASRNTNILSILKHSILPFWESARHVKHLEKGVP